MLCHCSPSNEANPDAGMLDPDPEPQKLSNEKPHRCPLRRFTSPLRGTAGYFSLLRQEIILEAVNGVLQNR